MNSIKIDLNEEARIKLSVGRNISGQRQVNMNNNANPNANEDTDDARNSQIGNAKSSSEVLTLSASEPVRVGFYLETEARGLPLPTYATTQAAGMDLYAALPDNIPLILRPGQRALITTGMRLILPSGYEGQIRARSGWAVRHGIGVLNAPGTIDSDFRGVMQILLINWGEAPFVIQRGDRIAQLIIAPVVQVAAAAVETYDDTVRGSGGFGSTGSTLLPVPVSVPDS